MDIWAACREAVAPGPLEGELIRIVESQEKIATNAIVESLEDDPLIVEFGSGNSSKTRLLLDNLPNTANAGGVKVLFSIVAAPRWILPSNSTSLFRMATSVRTLCRVMLAASPLRVPSANCACSTSPVTRLVIWLGSVAQGITACTSCIGTGA